MEITIQNFDIKLIDWREIKPLQGTLKELYDENYEKLKKSLIEKGYFMPLVLWYNTNDKTYYCVDGHAREMIFGKEKPVFRLKGKKTDNIPCLIIQADNIKDAKEKLLLISSQFNTMTNEGFLNYITDLDREWLRQTTQFDGINQFSKDLLEVPGVLESELKNKQFKITLTFTSKEQLEKAQPEIKDLLKKYEGSYHSLSAGEI